MNICFFSDEYSSNFKPLTLTRPLDDLRIGIFTIRDKWINVLKPSGWIRQVDDYLSQLFPTGKIVDNEDYLWINNRYLPSPELTRSLQNLSLNNSIVVDDQLIAARLSNKETVAFLESNQQPNSKNVIGLDFEPTSLQFFGICYHIMHPKLPLI